jgi:hypothetical protein
MASVNTNIAKRLTIILKTRFKNDTEPFSSGKEEVFSIEQSSIHPEQIDTMMDFKDILYQLTDMYDLVGQSSSQIGSYQFTTYTLQARRVS